MPYSSIRIQKGTILGYSFQVKGKAPITGTVELCGDVYVDEASRLEDGSWSYDLAPGRTYLCAGGLATVLPDGAAAAVASAE